ncbi:MAG TPA: hypothetical protein VNZ53_14415 [Steroidobacteraceae bacterium]|nr:hypothetical protein [Steroidobacteraceae bacterium]
MAGDLFEEYQQGRSRAWYWKQVAAAVVAARIRPIRVKTRLILLKIFGYSLADLGIVLLCSQIAESEHRARPEQYLLSPANIAVMAMLGLIAAIGIGIVIWVKRQAPPDSPN